MWPKIFTKKEQAPAGVDPDVKRRILSSNENVLRVMSQSVKEGSICPMLGGSPCVGAFCTFWTHYKSTNAKTGKEAEFYNCSLQHNTFLMMELNRNVNTLINAVSGPREGQNNEKDVHDTEADSPG